MRLLRTLRRATALLLAAGLVACERGAPGDSTRDDAGSEPRAEYTRQMIFVAADATGAALLDFSATDAGSVVRRSARGWAEAGSGWTPLYDLAWEGIAVRRPWRLVPNGPIRLRVGIHDEVEAIFVRDGASDLASLEFGDFIAEWAPYGTSQIVLREATLALGSEPMTGWLVDAHFGVTPQAAADDSAEGFVPNRAGVTSATAAAETQEDSAAPPSDDSIMNAVIDDFEAGSARMPVRAVRGVLATADGETLVIGTTDTGLGAWLWTEDGETTFATVTLTLAQGERESWTIAAGGATPLSGTLTVMDEEPMPVSPRIVRGTVRVGDQELEMHGVLRPGQ